MANDDRKVAREKGESAGARLEHSGAECPYGHEALELRTAWFDGFSIGRASNAHHRGRRY